MPDIDTFPFSASLVSFQYSPLAQTKPPKLGNLIPHTDAYGRVRPATASMYHPQSMSCEVHVLIRKMPPVPYVAEPTQVSGSMGLSSVIQNCLRGRRVLEVVFEKKGPASGGPSPGQERRDHVFLNTHTCIHHACSLSHALSFVKRHWPKHTGLWEHGVVVSGPELPAREACARGRLRKEGPASGGPPAAGKHQAPSQERRDHLRVRERPGR